MLLDLWRAESRDHFPLRQYFITSARNTFSKGGQMCRSSFSLPRSFPLGSWFFSGCVVQQHNHGPCKAGDGRLLLKQYLLKQTIQLRYCPFALWVQRCRCEEACQHTAIHPFLGNFEKGIIEEWLKPSLSYKGNFSQKPLCQTFRLLRGREVSYGMGGGKWLYFVFRILYILVTGKKPAIMPIPLLVQGLLLLLFWGLVFLVFSGFEEQREEEEDPELQEFHSWHAKAISRNAQIFHNGLDTSHSKRSHFIVSCRPRGDTLHITQLQGEGSTSLHYRESWSVCELLLHSQPSGCSVSLGD